MAASSRSQTERLWLLGGGLLAALVLLVGYFLLIGPQRSETSGVNSDLASARVQNASLQQRIVSLRAQSKSMSSVRTQLAAAQRALPSTSGLPDFLRTLQSLGNSTLAKVTSVTVGAPTDVSTVAAGTAGTATPGTAAAPVAGSSAAAGTAAAAPTGPSVYGLTISAQVAGSPAALNQFLEQLQAVQPRAVLITQLTEGTGNPGAAGATAAGAAGSATNLQLTMQAFVAPTSAAENAGLAAAAH